MHSINKVHLRKNICFEEVCNNAKKSTHFHFNNSIIFTTQFHATYGSIMPGRYFSSGTGYRYGFNTQEKSDEISGNGNHTTALFWEYDTRLGRRRNVDPKPNASISSYACVNNNPVFNSDVNGDSAVCNSKGYMTHYDPNDKDLRVFLQKSKDLKLISTIGGSIDINEIFGNMLLENRQEAKKIDKAQWVYNVYKNHKWDYKDLNSTNKTITKSQYHIFGVSWEYDNKHKNEGKLFTKFTYKNIVFQDASDVGNYHAGYTGTHCGINDIFQLIGAGVIETSKDLAEGEFNGIKEQIDISFCTGYFTPPFLDEIDDFYWNTRGIQDAHKEINMDNNPQPIQVGGGIMIDPN